MTVISIYRISSPSAACCVKLNEDRTILSMAKRSVDFCDVKIVDKFAE